MNLTDYSLYLKITPFRSDSESRVFDDLKATFEEDIMRKEYIRFPKELEAKIDRHLNWLTFDSFYRGDGARITVAFTEELTESEQDKLKEFLTNIIESRDSQNAFSNIGYSVHATDFLYDWK